MISRILLATIVAVGMVAYTSSESIAQCKSGCTSCTSSTNNCDTGCASGCAGCKVRLVKPLRIPRLPCVSCPECSNEVCVLKSDVKKEKKTCWKVECKTICIPKVTLPWLNCCAPQFAKTRKVRVLKKHTYECDKCSHKWEVQKVCEAEAGAVKK